MRRFFLGLLIVFGGFLLIHPKVSASYLTIDPKGSLIFDKVLSLEDEKGSISIKSIENTTSPISDAKVILNRDNGKLTLNVESASSNTTSDVTNFRDNIIEIEQRGDTQRVQIGYSSNKFSISQNGFTVYTSYPIEVDSKKAQVSVYSPSGVRFLSILPYDAITYIVRSNIITNTAPTTDSLELSENEKGDLMYEISGIKKINLFNVYNLDVPVKTTISATNGHVLSVDAPIWYKVLGFMFS